MIVGLSGIGKSTFARQAALKIDTASELLDVRPVTRARIRYMQHHHTLLRIDMTSLPQISEENAGSFDRAFVAEVHKQLFQTQALGPAGLDGTLAAGLLEMAENIPNPGSVENAQQLRGILLNLDETNEHVRVGESARTHFGAFVNRLVGAAAEVFKQQHLNTAIFITLSGTHADDLFKSTSTCARVQKATISLPPLTVDHMLDVLQRLLPDGIHVCRSPILKEALAWCGGVPR